MAQQPQHLSVREQADAFSEPRDADKVVAKLGSYLQPNIMTGCVHTGLFKRHLLKASDASGVKRTGRLRPVLNHGTTTACALPLL